MGESEGVGKGVERKRPGSEFRDGRVGAVLLAICVVSYVVYMFL
jgi:hypothetical protein